MKTLEVYSLLWLLDAMPPSCSKLLFFLSHSMTSLFPPVTLLQPEQRSFLLFAAGASSPDLRRLLTCRAHRTALQTAAGPGLGVKQPVPSPPELLAHSRGPGAEPSARCSRCTEDWLAKATGCWQSCGI